MSAARIPFVWSAISAVVLAALIAVVFLGSTLLSGLPGLSAYLIAVAASATIAVALAIPMAKIGKVPHITPAA